MKNNNDFNNNYSERLRGNIERTWKEILPKHIYNLEAKLSCKYALTKEPVKFSERLKLEYKNIEVNKSWSNRVFDCGWFNFTGKISNYDSSKKYFLHLDISGEALLFDKDGTVLKGFTNGSSTFDRNHGEPGKMFYELPHNLIKDGKVDLWVDGGSNDLFGNLDDNGIIKFMEIVTINPKVVELYFDVEVLYWTVVSMDKNLEHYNLFFNEMQEVYYLCSYLEENWLEKALEKTKKLLSMTSNVKLDVTAIGHSHIDLAWLWPIRETKRKTARTLANVFYLYEKYPEFKFGMSQPQQVKWIKENHPDLYEKIHKYYKEGRFEPQGCMWVEADTNVPSEEALVRQMLYGYMFWKKEFDFEPKSLWLPDVFGYAGNMPQIIKKSGMDYFMTTKISWSLVNKFPYNSYWWEGVDGTRVLTHMPPEGTYNSAITPKKLHETYVNYGEKELAPVALSLFGIGDGGGGPGVEHAERIKREKNLYSLPKVEYGTSYEFFKKLEKYQDNLPTYKGELYLENHQGCYTSSHSTKKYNHLMEEKLIAVETLLTLTNKFGQFKEQLNKIWEEVLLYQFHDILPGSSIMRVYKESDKRYKEMSKELDDIVSKVFKNKQTHYFNPRPYDSYKIDKQKNKYVVYDMHKFSTENKVSTYELVGKGSHVVETNGYVYTFNKTYGYIDSILDKNTNTNVLTGKGNKLDLYKDLGNGWDIPDHYRKQTPETLKLASQEINDYGRFVEFLNVYNVLKTTVKERVLVDKETDLVYFYHDTNFKDMKKMLRTSFEINVFTEDVVCDIQFGELVRKTTEDNLVDWAQFEIPAQQWILQEDNEKGCALITNGKYGFYSKGNILDINLCRSSDYPGKVLGLGKTDYSYMFVPYNHCHYYNNIDRLSRIFNTHYPKVDQSLDFSKLINISNEKIEVSAIKLAELDDSYIIRLYNPNKDIVKCKLDVNIKHSKVVECNMIEKDIKELGNNCELEFTKYEVKTIKVYK